MMDLLVHLGVFVFLIALAMAASALSDIRSKRGRIIRNVLLVVLPLATIGGYYLVQRAKERERKEQAQRVVDNFAPAVKAKVSQLVAVANQIQNLKELDEDGVSYSEPALTDENLAFIAAEDLYRVLHMAEGDTEQKHPSIDFSIESALNEPVLAPLLGTDASTIEKNLGGLIHLDYVVVVKTLSWRSPQVIAASKTYVSGEYAGDAYLFRLADGKNLGGFRVRTSNSQEVEVLGDVDDRIANSAVESDLNRQVVYMIRKLAWRQPGGPRSAIIPSPAAPPSIPTELSKDEPP